ncbi:MAG: tRNA (adenosine(37)-N6)-threonylcarbamoyltransferase complex ATPase subunit type 1 TsaE [Clostridia bacterium]|nr:tRNA (adenosine(37)-N6)-threonylcarbamoyltransferase complex ATPase subunit type 1 TsaE [Clostridia bacterium]
MKARKYKLFVDRKAKDVVVRTFESRSEAETVKIAKDFAKTLKPGDIVALAGDLGAGKTAFTKGVAQAFGVSADVTSPTFTIVNQYDGEEITLYHFDAYRLENVSVDDCDWLDDYFFSEGVCLIEWAQNIEAILPRGYKTVRIEKNISLGQDYREIVIEE